MKFELLHIDGNARTGSISTDHGIVRTPAFMPVGTQGVVKAINQKILEEIGVEIILSNCYHLYLRPGIQILLKAGGLHKFMSWNRPLLTDSGGYQIYSLPEFRKVSDDGVQFRSHIDGSLHNFRPEDIIDIQRIIGSDIMMVLDECTGYPCDKAESEKSNNQSMRWAERCWEQFQNTSPLFDHRQSLFGIVQGGVYEDLREVSASFLSKIDFHGYAIGGLAVGEPVEMMYTFVEVCTRMLPSLKPRYLMGVGKPENLLEAIGRGVDLFDCVLPTRNGRNAGFFTKNGELTITNSQFKEDFTPIDDHCGCYTCRNFSRSYLRHLFISKEILGLELATIHNLYYYQWLMHGAQEAILQNRYETWKMEQLASYQQELAIYS